MTKLKFTSSVHVSGSLPPKGGNPATVVLGPGAAAVTAAYGSGDQKAFVDAAGNVLALWPKASADYSHFTEVGELAAYANNKFNQVIINSAGNYYNPQIGIGPPGALAPATYLATFAAQMLP